CSRPTGSPSKTRWWFGTLETHATKRFGSCRGPGSLPAGTGNRRRTKVPATAEAGGDSPEEAWRKDLAVLSPRLRLDSAWRDADHGWIFRRALCAVLAANAAAEAGPD